MKQFHRKNNKLNATKKIATWKTSAALSTNTLRNILNKLCFASLAPDKLSGGAYAHVLGG